MRTRKILWSLLTVATAACAGTAADGPTRPDSRGPATAAAGPLAPEDLARLASRSLWGVLAEIPPRGHRLTPEMVRGSAVAVSPRHLVTSCRLLADLSLVPLIRARRGRVAQIAALHKEQDVCVVAVAAGPTLAPVRGFRTADDLRAGEPVWAVTSRSRADYTVSPGRFVARRGGPGPSTRIEVSNRLPPGKGNAALFDAFGNLVGVVAATRAGTVEAVPIEPYYAPRLANRDGAAAASTAAPALGPAVEPASGPAVFPFRGSGDGDAGGGGEGAGEEGFDDGLGSGDGSGDGGGSGPGG